MKQHQQQDQQGQRPERNRSHGADRRHEPQGRCQGDERRKPNATEEMPGGNPQGGQPGMSTQERKDGQQEKMQQERDHKSD